MHRFVTFALVDAHGRVLMQERDEHAPVDPDTWVVPGGGIEPGEDPAAAVVRELAEETGVTLADGLTEVGTFRTWSPACGTDDEFVLFLATTGLEDSDIVCGEGRRMVFVEPARTAELAVNAATRLALTAVLASDAYVGVHGRRPGHRFGAVALLDRRGHLLLQERDEHPVLDPEKWGLPGGHLEDGEDARAGALRELEEETGVRLAPEAVARVGSFEVYHPAYDSLDEVTLFAARADLHDDDVDCREGRRMVFVAPDDARRLDLTASAAIAVPAFLDSDLVHRLA